MTTQDTIFIWLAILFLAWLDKPNITCIAILAILFIAWHDIIKSINKH